MGRIEKILISCSVFLAIAAVSGEICRVQAPAGEDLGKAAGRLAEDLLAKSSLAGFSGTLSDRLMVRGEEKDSRFERLLLHALIAAFQSDRQQRYRWIVDPEEYERSTAQLVEQLKARKVSEAAILSFVQTRAGAARKIPDYTIAAEWYWTAPQKGEIELTVRIAGVSFIESKVRCTHPDAQAALEKRRQWAAQLRNWCIAAAGILFFFFTIRIAGRKKKRRASESASELCAAARRELLQGNVSRCAEMLRCALLLDNENTETASFCARFDSERNMMMLGLGRTGGKELCIVKKNIVCLGLSSAGEPVIDRSAGPGSVMLYIAGGQAVAESRGGVFRREEPLTKMPVEDGDIIDLNHEANVLVRLVRSGEDGALCGFYLESDNRDFLITEGRVPVAVAAGGLTYAPDSPDAVEVIEGMVFFVQRGAYIPLFKKDSLLSYTVGELSHESPADPHC